MFEQGSLMFRSACYKDLSGVGVRMDWKGKEGGWSPERSPKEVRSRGQGSEFYFESALPGLSPQLLLLPKMTFSMAS